MNNFWNSDAEQIFGNRIGALSGQYIGQVKKIVNALFHVVLIDCYGGKDSFLIPGIGTCKMKLNRDGELKLEFEPSSKLLHEIEAISEGNETFLERDVKVSIVNEFKRILGLDEDDF